MNNAIAGLNANSRLVAAAAHNLANVNTNNYKAVNANVIEGPNGAPQVVTEKSTQAGSLLSDGQQTSNVEIATETVNLIKAQNGFEAALKAVSARDEQLKDLMETFKNRN